MGTDGVQRFEISTHDEAEAEEFIRQTYVGNRTQFLARRDGAGFSVCAASVADIATDHLRSSVDYSAACDPFGYFFAFAVNHGRLSITSRRGETIVPPGGTALFPLGVETQAGCVDADMRTLRIPVAMIAGVAEETAGINAADLRFEGSEPVSAGMARTWFDFMGLASTMLLADDCAGRPLVAAELARTAAVTALHTFPNTALTVAYRPGPGWVAPGAVRRAAAFIHAHADEPVTTDQIAAAAGTAVRSLQAAFRRHYEITLAGYLRRVRLERAHAELDGGLARGVTVQTVAHRWGWASPSSFSAAYQQRFGVRPSQTLRLS